jgi:hypothetical protein
MPYAPKWEQQERERECIIKEDNIVGEYSTRERNEKCMRSITRRTWWEEITGKKY